MRETPLSNCERQFLLKAITQKKRIDGREAYDYRRVKITFGVDRGCCNVELGQTRVMAQVSCEVTEPRQTRPTEGILFVNVELSPMAAPHFEAGRQSDTGVEITRLLERCIKESRCVDTESLCIMAGIKVWSVRVDIHVLNHDGNIVDCASVAAIAALAHFRRPDVTVSGEEVTVHAPEDRDPVPLSVHHMPLCVTFGFYEQGKYLLVDPNDKEEKIMDGKMVIAMNKHREICTLQMTGSMLLLKDQVLRCSNIAVVKVTEITELIQKALENDSKARAAGEKFGFAVSLDTSKVTANRAMPEPVSMETTNEEADDMEENGRVSDDLEDDSLDEDVDINILAPGTGHIGEGGPSTWDMDEEDDEVTMIENERKPIAVHDLTGSGDSEEEQVVMLNQEDLGFKKEAEADVQAGLIDLSKALRQAKEESKKSGKKKVKP